MKLKHWLILSLCILLPLESIAATSAHCAKIKPTALLHQVNMPASVSDHDHCSHSLAKTMTVKPQNLQKDCGTCKAHSLSLLIFIPSLMESPELFGTASINSPEAITLSPFITLPYKPPQFLFI